jgi:predicted DNA-binding transcriptional regulator AlpA
MRLLSTKQVAKMMGDIHIKTVHRWVREGRLPKPIKLADNRDAFVEDEIVDNIKARIAKRDAEVAQVA